MIAQERLNFMNIKKTITITGLTILLYGCAINPTPLTTSNGKQGYTIQCDSGVAKCEQKAAKLCPDGYDILDHSKKTTTLVPHYGEYPMTVNIENLTVECK